MSTPIPRRTMLRYVALGTGAAIVGPTVLTACGSDSDGGSSSGTSPSGSAASGGGSTTDVAVQLSWQKTVEFAPYYIADDRGFFAENGLSVELLGGGPNSPAPEQSVTGGSSAFGNASAIGNVVSALDTGADLVVFGAQLQTEMYALISLEDNPVRSLEDLQGKKIGSGTAPLEQVYRNLMEANGLDPDFEFIPAGFDPAPLLEGQVDVYVGFKNNQPLTMEDMGYEPVILTHEEIGLPGYHGLQICTRSYLEENRDQVVGFLRATIMGAEIDVSDPAIGAELAANEYGADLGLDVERETRANETYIEAMQSPLTEEKGLYWMDLDRVAGPIYDSLAYWGLTDLPDPESYIDLSVLDEVYGDSNSLTT